MSATAILIATVLAVLCVFAIALLAGALALFSGAEGEADSRRSGLLEAMRLLDRQWRIERLIYRHHRLFAVVVLTAVAFSVWQMTRAELTGLLVGDSPASVFVWALLLAQAFNFVVGLTLLLRPSLLKPVEALSNRWHHLAPLRGSRPGTLRLRAALLALVGLAVLLGSATLLLLQIRTVFG